MKLSVNEAKLIDLCARNCATVQQVLILTRLKLPSLPRSRFLDVTQRKKKRLRGRLKVTGSFEERAPEEV